MKPIGGPVPLPHPSMKSLKASDYKQIARMFGKQFRSQVGKGIVKMKKTKSGAFFVESEAVLRQCTMLAKQLFDEREKNKRSASPHIMERSKPGKTVDDYLKKHINDDSFEETSDEECDIKDDETIRKQSVTQWQVREPGKLAYVEFPSNHVLNQFPSVEWWKKVLGQTHHMSQKYLPKLDPIMRDFALRHSNFDYFEIINSLSEKGDHRYQVEMPENELKAFFSKVFVEVKPMELFGSRMNDKIIKKAIFRYLRISARSSFPFDDILNDLDLSDIKWLTTRNMEKKFLILGDLLYWFVKQYIVVILKTFFYESRSKDSTEPVFVPIKKWIKLRDDFIEGMKVDGSIEPCLYRESDKIPPVTQMLYLKAGGLRPIYQALATTEQKTEAIILKQLLIQVWATHSEEVQPYTLHKFWKPIVAAKRRTQQPLYFVTADISNAYGSILQDKLVNILEKLLIVLPEELSLPQFETLDPQYPKSLRSQEKFYDDSLPLLFPSCTITACQSPDKIATKSRDFLIERLRYYIKNQIVIIGHESYKLSRGVGQGTLLSAILSDIYYGTMELTELQEFKRDGTLIRYVDDFLYVTFKKESAEKFLAVVNEGISGYNCSFKTAKTHTNVTTNPDTKFTYVGYHFDADTLEAEPDYSAPPSEYTMTVEIDEHEALVFRSRMLHVKTLKLSRLVLDLEVNSRKKIQSVIKSAARRSALRCQILVTHMLDIDHLNVAMIGVVIDEVVDQLWQLVMKHQPEGRPPMFLPKKWLYKEFLHVFLNNEKFKDTLGGMLENKISGLPKELPPHKQNNHREDIADK